MTNRKKARKILFDELAKSGWQWVVFNEDEPTKNNGIVETILDAMIKFDKSNTVLADVQTIYDTHMVKLNSLKENRSKSDEENWTDAEIVSVDAQIALLASILSDLHRNIIHIN